jgi:uncharacterized tellurite resistance protein B-like protein
VIKKVRTYSGSLTLANQDLLLPDQLLEQHEAKQQAAIKSERQMTAQTAHLDQEERERHVNYMRAIASGSQEVPDASESALRRRKLERQSRCWRSSRGAPERGAGEL